MNDCRLVPTSRLAFCIRAVAAGSDLSGAHPVKDRLAPTRIRRRTAHGSAQSRHDPGRANALTAWIVEAGRRTLHNPIGKVHCRPTELDTICSESSGAEGVHWSAGGFTGGITADASRVLRRLHIQRATATVASPNAPRFSHRILAGWARSVASSCR